MPAQGLFRMLFTREREREFIGTNIKQFHGKIKLRRWDTEKKLKALLQLKALLLTEVKLKY